jgi:hypothetical protein
MEPPRASKFRRVQTSSPDSEPVNNVSKKVKTRAPRKAKDPKTVPNNVSKKVKTRAPRKAKMLKEVEAVEPPKASKASKVAAEPNVPKPKVPALRNLIEINVMNKQYTRASEDNYDGAIFIIGHSSFKGKLCHLPTKDGMKQKTILVAPPGAVCAWTGNTVKFEAHIKKKFSHALSYQATNTEDITYTVKERAKHVKSIKQEMIKNPSIRTFFETRGSISELSEEYCEREWKFYNTDPREYFKILRETLDEGKPLNLSKMALGTVMLLRRDAKGKPSFENLYKDEIEKGRFKLKKTDLYDKLYKEPYNLRNILLVDFGCSTFYDVDERNQEKLHRGRI